MSIEFRYTRDEILDAPDELGKETAPLPAAHPSTVATDPHIDADGTAWYTNVEDIPGWNESEAVAVQPGSVAGTYVDAEGRVYYDNVEDMPGWNVPIKSETSGAGSPADADEIWHERVEDLPGWGVPIKLERPNPARPTSPTTATQAKSPEASKA
jgi:hypothetical protein